MKQKFSLVRDTEKNSLIIKEFAELDKEILSLLCEESYPDEMVQSAIEQGKPKLISAIRTHNLYPPAIYSQKIVDAIVEMYAEDGPPSAELFFDDRELFAEVASDNTPDGEEELESEESSVEVDDLLEDDLDDDYDEDSSIVNNLKSSLKVSDDDSSDLNNTP